MAQPTRQDSSVKKKKNKNICMEKKVNRSVYPINRAERIAKGLELIAKCKTPTTLEQADEWTDYYDGLLRLDERNEIVNIVARISNKARLGYTERSPRVLH